MRQPCPADRFAHHVVARLDGQLIGCIRLLRTAAPLPGLTETLLAREGVDQALVRLQSSRERTADVGRWIVHPEARRGPLGAQLVAAGWAYLLAAGLKTATAVVGTRRGQDRLLATAGLAPVPGFGLVQSASFADDLRIMYAVLNNPSPGFDGMVREMGERLGIARLSVPP